MEGGPNLHIKVGHAALSKARIFDAVNAVIKGEPEGRIRFTQCPKCGEALEPPAPAIQIQSFRAWQQRHSAYYCWNERELLLLEGHLAPGDVIVPTYAHTCNVRRSDGSSYTWLRQGRVKS
jgi:hypothetical protein